jgi:hypothetical protein
MHRAVHQSAHHRIRSWDAPHGHGASPHLRQRRTHRAAGSTPTASAVRWPQFIGRCLLASAATALLPILHAMAAADVAILGLGAVGSRLRALVAAGSRATDDPLHAPPSGATAGGASQQPWPRPILLFKWGHLLGAPLLLLLPGLAAACGALGWPTSPPGPLLPAAAAARTAAAQYLWGQLLAPVAVAALLALSRAGAQRAAAWAGAAGAGGPAAEGRHWSSASGSRAAGSAEPGPSKQRGAALQPHRDVTALLQTALTWRWCWRLGCHYCGCWAAAQAAAGGPGASPAAGAAAAAGSSWPLAAAGAPLPWLGDAAGWAAGAAVCGAALVTAAFWCMYWAGVAQQLSGGGW